METNRLLWDELAPLHAASAFYDVARFRSGSCTLGAIERREVGDVEGKRLLHLLCHLGLDSLSWSRLGAIVTGVDLSPVSVAFAQALAAQSGIAASFVCSNVYDVAARLRPPYDIVFLSKGVLPWLPDLPALAATVAGLLRPGGVFYLLDAHPLTYALREDDQRLHVKGTYFETAHPAKVVADGSYAVPGATLTNATSFEWTHSLGDVVTALAGAGIRLEFLHEFPATMSGDGPTLHGSWRSQAARRSLPAMFSVRGVRE